MTNEQAIEILNNELEENIWAKPEFELREAINTAIKALEQTRWRDPKDEPPEDDTMVIATTSKGIVDTASAYGSNVAVDSEYYLNGGPGEVVAWMPLPEALEVAK